MRVLEHFLHHPNCCAEKAAGDPSSPSGTGPVQLVATSPKATRLKDVRTWQPQVPRWGGLEVCRIEVLVLVSNFEMCSEFGMTLVCTVHALEDVATFSVFVAPVKVPIKEAVQRGVIFV